MIWGEEEEDPQWLVDFEWETPSYATRQLLHFVYAIIGAASQVLRRYEGPLGLSAPACISCPHRVSIGVCKDKP